MRRRNRTLGLAAALVGIILVGAVAMSVATNERGSNAEAAETDATRTVTVNGEGRVSLRPDTVSMQLGVDVLDEDLGTAQSDAAARMEAVIAAIRGAGVAEADIQTSGYSISVERDWNSPEQPVVGYRVSQTVTAKVRNVDGAGSVIQAAVDAGANNVYGVWFSLENPSQAVAQARELAVADAKAKAEELARLTNATLGPVQSIVEGYSSAMPIDYVKGGTGAGADSTAASVPMNPGQTEVVLTVTVSYAIS